MAYTPPLGSAANFTALGYYEPREILHAFKFPAGTYTAPLGNAVNFVRPESPQTTNFVIQAVVYSAVEGAGVADISITTEAHGIHEQINIDASGVGFIDLSASGTGAHGVAGSGSAAITLSATGAGAHGVAGSAIASLGLSATAAGIVERYEVRGEVRKDGILINRLVRVYRRDTGALVGEQETTAGRFALHCGFVEREHYLVPIDLANDAVDWAPPVANRVLSVLASDTA